MEEPSEIASIFGGDEAQASRIPEDLRPVLLERWSKLRKELDSSRPDVSGASASDSAEARKDEDPSKFYTFYTWLEIFNSWIEYQFQRLLPHPNHVQRQKGVSVRVKFLVKLWFRKLLRATFVTKLTQPIHMIEILVCIEFSLHRRKMFKKLPPIIHLLLFSRLLRF